MNLKHIGQVGTFYWELLEDGLLSAMEMRFWTKVLMPELGCWIWNSVCNKNGYGKFGLYGKSVLAHRLAYELVLGKIPDGLQLDHLCRVRNCVNPIHLEPVTCKENIRRGIAAGNGHPANRNKEKSP